MNIKRSIITVFLAVAYALSLNVTLADEQAPKRPDEEFMELLGTMAAAAEAASKQHGEQAHEAFKNLAEVAKKTENGIPKSNSGDTKQASKEPSMEALFGPFLQQLTGLAGASMGAVGALAESELARDQAARGNEQSGVDNKLTGKAALLAISGKNGEAADVYRQAIEKNPEDAAAFFGLSTVLATLGKNDEALAALGKAITFDPKYSTLAARESAFDDLRKDPRFSSKITQ